MISLNTITANKPLVGALVGGITMGTIGALSAEPGKRFGGFMGGALMGATLGSGAMYLYGRGKNAIAANRDTARVFIDKNQYGHISVANQELMEQLKQAGML